MMSGILSHPLDFLAAWDNDDPFQREIHWAEEKEETVEKFTEWWDSEEALKHELAQLDHWRDMLAHQNEEPPKEEPKHQFSQESRSPLLISLLREPSTIFNESFTGCVDKENQKRSPKNAKREEKENRTPPMSGRIEKKEKKTRRRRNIKRESSTEKDDPKVTDKIMKLLKEAKEEEDKEYADFGGASWSGTA